jgi:hypothetical protein
MSEIRKITLLFAFLIPLNAFSQSNDCIEVLYSAIRSIVVPDMEEYMEQYTEQIMRDSNNNMIDSVEVIYLNDVVIISFNSKEYIELTGNRGKISRLRTFRNLSKIERALDKDCTVRHDLFDSFIYRYSIRLESGFGWDAEYKIKMDDDGMRIIGLEINVVSPPVEPRL